MKYKIKNLRRATLSLDRLVVYIIFCTTASMEFYWECLRMCMGTLGFQILCAMDRDK